MGYCFGMIGNFVVLTSIDYIKYIQFVYTTPFYEIPIISQSLVIGSALAIFESRTFWHAHPNFPLDFGNIIIMYYL